MSSFYQNFYINFFVEFWRDFIWFILNEIKDKKLNINEYENKMNWISFQTTILSIHFATNNHLYLSHQLNLSFCFISFQLDKWNDSVCDAELINTVIFEIENFSLTQSFLNVNQHRLNQSQFHQMFIPLEMKHLLIVILWKKLNSMHHWTQSSSNVSMLVHH